jgi:hypothetical protein
MKHALLLEQLRNLKTNPPLKRKLKIFLGVGLAGIVMIGALVAWAGIATFKSVASIGANPVVQEKIKSWNNTNVQEKIVSLDTGVKNLPALTKVGCWTTAQSLMKVEVWIAKPFVENLNSLKLACLNK